MTVLIIYFNSWMYCCGYQLLSVRIMAILKCLTHMLEMFIVKVTFKGHVFY